MHYKDPMKEILENFTKAECDAAALYDVISKDCGADAARLIFTALLKRRRGRRPTAENKQNDRWFLALHNLGLTSKNIVQWAYKNKMVHSKEAAQKQIQRLLKKERDK